jgi:hypothetical protein
MFLPTAIRLPLLMSDMLYVRYAFACHFPAMESSFDSQRQAEAYRTYSGNSGNRVFIR